ncbi:MAG: hypothetical protein GX804_01070 [Lentisphaerae bacterium]|jgi:hypothetical protein|nr:hypothetical protein [Lentisphaerota bacterium]
MIQLDEILQDIEATSDLLERGVKLAGAVSKVFADAGHELVVVGGSAVEIYTEGAYMSGDIDFCRRNLAPIPLRQAQDIMSLLGATGGPRSWKVAGLYIDLLGLLENESLAPCRTIDTPYGPVTVMPPELVLVERALSAFYPQVSQDARDVAQKMLVACISGCTPVDWEEIDRLASLPEFNIKDELALLKKETEDELKKNN